MAREFKAFLLHGNVVDLAVGIVVGAAFGAVVTALVRSECLSEIPRRARRCAFCTSPQPGVS